MRAMTMAILLSAGCPSWRSGGENPALVVYLRNIDRAWGERARAGFDPVTEAVNEAELAYPASPEVAWRASRLWVGRGLAAEDRRAAMTYYSHARDRGVACLDADPAFLQRRRMLGWHGAAEVVGPERAECLAWTAFGWVRWVVEHGADAAALDLAVLDLLVFRSRDLSKSTLPDWTEGLLLAIRPDDEGRTYAVAGRMLAEAVKQDKEELSRRADLLLHVAVPTENWDLVRKLLETMEAEAEFELTPEDRRALERARGVEIGP